MVAMQVSLAHVSLSNRKSKPWRDEAQMMHHHMSNWQID
jgi:hypothetical protein